MVPKNWTGKKAKRDIISEEENGNYMSKKGKQYSATEKTKIVTEAIKAKMTIAQISSKYGVHATQIQAWKKEVQQNSIRYGVFVRQSKQHQKSYGTEKQLYVLHA